MADTTVHGTPTSGFDTLVNSRFSCSPSPGVVYTLTVEATTFDVQYLKFSGGSWGAAVDINLGNNRGMTCWYDQWTKDYSATNKMLILMCETNADDGLFNALDLDDDSLDGEVIMFDGASANVGAGQDLHQQSIIRAMSGRIYAYIDIDGGTEVEFAESDDEGASWNQLTTVGLFEATTDRFLLVPADLADEDDIYAVYYDESAGELTLKVWDSSGGSWSESAAILSGLSTTINGLDYPLDAVQRHSDGHIIACVLTALDPAGKDADVKVVDITNVTTFSTKTDVVTDVDDLWLPRLMINQQNDDLRCAYLGAEDGSEIWPTGLACYFKFSDDGAATWGAETAMQEDAPADEEALSVGASVNDNGGNFMTIWFNETVDDLECNLNNDVEIAADTGPGADEMLAAMQQAMMPQVPQIPVIAY